LVKIVERWVTLTVNRLLLAWSVGYVVFFFSVEIASCGLRCVFVWLFSVVRRLPCWFLQISQCVGLFSVDSQLDHGSSQMNIHLREIPFPVTYKKKKKPLLPVMRGQWSWVGEMVEVNTSVKIVLFAILTFER
jgi:hypothetical protein